MLSRIEGGRLSLQSLDLKIFLGDVFAVCQTQKEIEWVAEQIKSCVDLIADERSDEL